MSDLIVVEGFDQYQALAKRTAVYSGHNEWSGIAYCALGLTGEAGETANQVKKMNRDDGTARKEERLAKIFHEMGDTQWYLAQLATELHFSLQAVIDYNIRMLEERASTDRIHGEGWRRGETLPHMSSREILARQLDRRDSAA